MLSRRAAFKQSMQFLYDLAKNGNVRAVSRWSLSSLFSWFGKDDSPETKMKSFGKKIAKSVLEQDRDIGNAAATLLLIALDGAYNSVLAVRNPPRAVSTLTILTQYSSRPSSTTTSMVYIITRRRRKPAPRRTQARANGSKSKLPR